MALRIGGRNKHRGEKFNFFLSKLVAKITTGTDKVQNKSKGKIDYNKQQVRISHSTAGTGNHHKAAYCFIYVFLAWEGYHIPLAPKCLGLTLNQVFKIFPTIQESVQVFHWHYRNNWQCMAPVQTCLIGQQMVRHCSGQGQEHKV